MEDVLKIDLRSYVFVALFLGSIVIELIYDTIINSKDFKTKKKRLCRSIAITAISVVWLGVLTVAVIPRVCAYIEYKTGSTEKTTGVVEYITGDRNSYYIWLDGKCYTLVRNRDYYIKEIVPLNGVGIGDTVTIKNGKYSNFIFEVENGK